MKISTANLTAELSMKEGTSGWYQHWDLPEGWPVPPEKMKLWAEIGALNAGVCCPLNGIGEFVVLMMASEGMVATVTQWDRLTEEDLRLEI